MCPTLKARIPVPRPPSPSASSEILPSATQGEPVALPPFMGERRGRWDPQAVWPSPETMHLLRAQCSWLEAGSVGDSPLALLLKSLKALRPEAGA